jgi:hypothetical protein
MAPLGGYIDRPGLVGSCVVVVKDRWRSPPVGDRATVDVAMGSPGTARAFAEGDVLIHGGQLRETPQGLVTRDRMLLESAPSKSVTGEALQFATPSGARAAHELDVRSLPLARNQAGASVKHPRALLLDDESETLCRDHSNDRFERPGGAPVGAPDTPTCPGECERHRGSDRHARSSSQAVVSSRSSEMAAWRKERQPGWPRRIVLSDTAWRVPLGIPRGRRRT